MPFGSFVAQRRDPRPRREKPAPKKPEPMKKPEVPVVPKEEQVVFQELSRDGQKLHILLLGRAMWQMQEFLCSMSENMSKELHRDGMTCYTLELNTIRDIVDRKKKLEFFFWEFSQENWPCPDDPETERVYTFSISPSGSQEKTLDLVFHCCVYGNEGTVSAGQADAVWYLADGPVLDPAVGYDDYRAFLEESIGALKAPADGMGKPVCLVLSQIERYGHFSGMGEQCLLKDDVRRTLLQRCREILTCGEGVAVAVIPVQVYGGLEYTGMNVIGKPILRLSESGYYQSYIPENCQVPGMYTIGCAAAIQGTDFLAGASCDGMKKVIHRHFARKKGELDWTPDMLREVSEG